MVSPLAHEAGLAVDRLTALVPDFPTPGILFRDLTPVFADAEAFRLVIDALVEPFTGRVDAVAGVEARGFLLAAAAGYALDAGVVAIRKAGKLPRETIGAEYALEYGTAALELQPDDLPAGCRVLVLDDVLATGGTLAAATGLVERAGWTVAGVSVVLELADLGGRARLGRSDLRALQQV